MTFKSLNSLWKISISKVNYMGEVNDMINTEIFIYESVNNYTCFDEVLKDVNKFIKENNINKDDIIEYRTDNWEENEKWHYKVILSYWT